MVGEVAITGLGVVHGAGDDPARLVDTLIDGRSPVRRRRINGRDFLGVPASRFSAQDSLGPRSARRLGRAAQLAAAAGNQAIERAQVDEAYAAERVAVVEATSTGTLAETLAYERALLRGRRGAGTRLLVTAMHGTAGSYLCSRHAVRGPALALSNGSCSSASALGVAWDLVRSGSVDAAVVTAGEAPLFAEILNLFAEARLGSRNVDDPDGACRPFDRDRDGTVLAEAGAAVVLERAAGASTRGARILARLVGVAQTSEGARGVRPGEDISQRSRAMQQALRHASFDPPDIDWICAHGTATALNDPHEAAAIRQAVGRQAETVPVTALKSTLGHALGACALLEVVAAISCLQRGVIPATSNLRHVAAGCELHHVRPVPLAQAAHHVLLNSASFGGRNATVALAA